MPCIYVQRWFITLGQRVWVFDFTIKSGRASLYVAFPN